MPHSPSTLNTTRFSFCTIQANSCFYEVLGIRPSASSHDIKQAYYARVKQYHPDHNQSTAAEEKFKIVARAYEILKDPVERKLYDFRKTSTGSGSTMNPTTQEFYQRASSGGTTSRSTNYYRNRDDYYYTGFHTSSGHDYQEAWERYNREEENQETLRARYYSNAGSTATPPQPTLFNTMIGRIAVIVALFGLYDMWRRQRNRGMSNPKANQLVHVKAGPTLSLGQMDFETHVGWGREEGMDAIRLQEEMKKKGFRIEYNEKPDTGNTEKKKKRVIMKRERRLPGLNEYISKKNLKIEKSYAGNAL